jgi:hypothetical protein
MGDRGWRRVAASTSRHVLTPAFFGSYAKGAALSGAAPFFMPRRQPVLEGSAGLALQERHRIPIERARFIELYARGFRSSIACPQIREILAKRGDTLPDPKRSEWRKSGTSDAPRKAEAPGTAGLTITLRRHCAPPRRPR